jgi:branched-chain amino acid transport system substrate-binding protein
LRGLRTRKAFLCVALVLGVVVSGCGSKTTVQGGNDTFTATTLTVYSDLPLLSSDAAAQQSVVDGEALALYNAGGRVRFLVHGRPSQLHVSLDSLNDADPKLDGWSDNATGLSAKTASQDLSSVAYIGDFDSGATAASLPLNNENGVLQISPGSPYLGFTEPGPGVPAVEPRSFYPLSGPHTFARLVPSYRQEAHASVSYMRSLGVRRLYLLADGADLLDAEIVPLVAADARAAGIALAGSRVVAGGSLAAPAGIRPAQFARTARAVAASHADAVLYGGAANVTAPALWRELHAVVPRAKLFAPSTLALPSFLTALGPAAGATYVTSPYLQPSQYPASGRQVLRELRRTFPGVTPTVHALYGYEAMRVVLAAIHRAGRQAPSRSIFRKAFFSLGQINGVIGSYRIDQRGDTSLDRFDGYRVGAGGALVLARAINGSAGL